LEETIWFALDTHEVLKIVRDETIDRKIDNSQMGGGMMGGGPGSGGSMTPGGMAPGGIGGPGGADRGDQMVPVNSLQQQGGFAKGGRGRGGPGGATGPGGPPGMGRPGGFPGGAGGPGFGAPQQSTATYIRIRFLRTFTLESN